MQLCEAWLSNTFEIDSDDKWAQVWSSYQY